MNYVNMNIEPHLHPFIYIYKNTSLRFGTPSCLERTGGPTTILAWAGKDATKFFNEIHKGVKSHGFEDMRHEKRDPGCLGII